MLRIRVELVPGGDERSLRELARADVSNVSMSPRSDYQVAACEGMNPLTGTPAWKSRGLIANHDRRQSVWALVAKVATLASREAEKQ